MQSKANKNGKIAAFVAKYSNEGSGASYRGAIQGFLRCIYHLPKSETVQVGTKVKTVIDCTMMVYIVFALQDSKR